MTKTVTNTGTKARLISKPKYIVATLNEGTENEKNYIFDHVLKDSTKFSQDENTKDSVQNEVSDDDIKTNVTLGAYQFVTTIEDVQDDLLVDICGFTKGTSGKLYAPSSYTERFAKIAVVLDNGVNESNEQQLVAYVAPKVQLNTKLILESLSTSMAGFSLAGTAKTAKVTDSAKSIMTPLYIDPTYTLPTVG